MASNQRSKPRQEVMLDDCVSALAGNDPSPVNVSGADARQPDEDVPVSLGNPAAAAPDTGPGPDTGNGPDTGIVMTHSGINVGERDHTPSALTPSTLPEILGPATVRYEQRIRIVEAWQYDGRLAKAPAWVDRNWAAWADADYLRNIAAGPAVRVPFPGADGNAPGGAAICRIGDYIVQQEVTVAPGITDIRVEVWAREQFEKFFIPGS